MRTLSFVPSTLLLWAEFFVSFRIYRKRVLSGISVLLSHLSGLVYGKVPADLPALARGETLFVFILDYKIALSSRY